MFRSWARAMDWTLLEAAKLEKKHTLYEVEVIWKREQSFKSEDSRQFRIFSLGTASYLPSVSPVSHLLSLLFLPLSSSRCR